MLSSLFGGFSSSKLKSHSAMAIQRIQLLRNKRQNALKAERREVSRLLAERKFDKARIRVEAVIRKEQENLADDLLEDMVDLLHARITLIAAERFCPPDLRECVHTLIFAAPRTQVDELKVVRQQLIARYGEHFCEPAMNGDYDHSFVNRKVMGYLSVAVPSELTKINALVAIAKEFDVPFDPAVDMPFVVPGGVVPSVPSAAAVEAVNTGAAAAAAAQTAPDPRFRPGPGGGPGGGAGVAIVPPGVPVMVSGPAMAGAAGALPAEPVLLIDPATGRPMMLAQLRPAPGTTTFIMPPGFPQVPGQQEPNFPPPGLGGGGGMPMPMPPVGLAALQHPSYAPAAGPAGVVSERAANGYQYPSPPPALHPAPTGNAPAGAGGAPVTQPQHVQMPPSPVPLSPTPPTPSSFAPSPVGGGSTPHAAPSDMSREEPALQAKLSSAAGRRPEAQVSASSPAPPAGAGGPPAAPVSGIVSAASAPPDDDEGEDPTAIQTQVSGSQFPSVPSGPPFDGMAEGISPSNPPAFAPGSAAASEGNANNLDSLMSRFSQLRAGNR